MSTSVTTRAFSHALDALNTAVGLNLSLNDERMEYEKKLISEVHKLKCEVRELTIRNCQLGSEVGELTIRNCQLGSEVKKLTICEDNLKKEIKIIRPLAYAPGIAHAIYAVGALAMGVGFVGQKLYQGGKKVIPLIGKGLMLAGKGLLIGVKKTIQVASAVIFGLIGGVLGGTVGYVMRKFDRCHTNNTYEQYQGFDFVDGVKRGMSNGFKFGYNPFKNNASGAEIFHTPTDVINESVSKKAKNFAKAEGNLKEKGRIDQDANPSINEADFTVTQGEHDPNMLLATFKDQGFDFSNLDAMMEFLKKEKDECTEEVSKEMRKLYAACTDAACCKKFVDFVIKQK